METNELPEDVKSKIDESAKEWARNHSSAPDKETPDWIETDFRGGAEFGYRLGLESCEGEVAQLKEQVLQTSNSWLKSSQEKDGQLKAKDEEIANLKTVMIAAAEEIQAHWQAHCDAEGYGPANLMHRLEKGIPAQYGYTAGAFMMQQELVDGQLVRINSLTSENERLREALRKIQLEAIGVGDYAISPESHELIDSILTKETCNHPATDKGPSGNIYCVVCLESLEILTETKPE